MRCKEEGISMKEGRNKLERLLRKEGLTVTVTYRYVG